MSEQDIDDIIATIDGDTSWGDDMRGAITTLKAWAEGGGVYTEYVITTLVANAAVTIDWSQGDHHTVNTAGYDVTSLLESNGPAAGEIQGGTLSITNSGGTASTVDTTGLDHGLSATFDVLAGSSEVLEVWSRG